MNHRKIETNQGAFRKSLPFFCEIWQQCNEHFSSKRKQDETKKRKHANVGSFVNGRKESAEKNETQNNKSKKEPTTEMMNKIAGS